MGLANNLTILGLGLQLATGTLPAADVPQHTAHVADARAALGKIGAHLPVKYGLLGAVASINFQVVDEPSPSLKIDLRPNPGRSALLAPMSLSIDLANVSAGTNWIQLGKGDKGMRFDLFDDGETTVKVSDSGKFGGDWMEVAILHHARGKPPQHLRVAISEDPHKGVIRLSRNGQELFLPIHSGQFQQE